MIDVEKARTFLYYTGKASGRLQERERAREKVAVAFDQLKKISTKTVQEDIARLTTLVNSALEKERIILSKQTGEEKAHQELMSKITALEVTLEQLSKKQSQREEKLKDLKDRIISATTPKQKKMSALKNTLESLEALYRKEREKGTHSQKELFAVEEKILLLKEKLRRLEEE